MDEDARNEQSVNKIIASKNNQQLFIDGNLLLNRSAKIIRIGDGKHEV